MSLINIEMPFKIGNIMLKNRLAKAPMVECLALPDGKISEELIRLYQAWARGGVGLSITGNFMIDKRALSDVNEPIIEDESDLVNLSRLAAVGRTHGVAQIVQISHPGKQCPKGLNLETVAPSAVGFTHKDLKALFGVPRALTEDEIFDLIQRFAETARICEKAGFEGVELHGAHGYLISQFLSPIHNKRTDQWGGSLENRMRFLIACYKEVRLKTSKNFIVGVKLNSADFQKGGFSEEESMIVYKCLDDLGVDFMEISGGTYEATQMFDSSKAPKKDSTLRREAFFLEFAEKVRREVKTTLMLTGGFRTPEGMNDALSSGACDLIGIGRPLAMDAAAAKGFMKGVNAVHIPEVIKTGIPALDRTAGLEVPWYAEQFKAIASGKTPNPELSPLLVLMKVVVRTIPTMVHTAYSRFTRILSV